MIPKPEETANLNPQPERVNRKAEPTSERVNVLQCDKCTLVFNNESEQSKHMLSEHHSQTRACYDCDMNFLKNISIRMTVS